MLCRKTSVFSLTGQKSDQLQLAINVNSRILPINSPFTSAAGSAHLATAMVGRVKGGMPLGKGSPRKIRSPKIKKLITKLVFLD